MENKSVHSCRFVQHAKFHCIMTTLNKLFKIEFERGKTGKELKIEIERWEGGGKKSVKVQKGWKTGKESIRPSSVDIRCDTGCSPLLFYSSCGLDKRSLPSNTRLEVPHFSPP